MLCEVCCNNVPQMRGLKTTQPYGLAVPESVRTQAVHRATPSLACGEESVLAPSWSLLVRWPSLAFFGISRRPSVSPSVCRLCVSFHIAFFSLCLCYLF